MRRRFRCIGRQGAVRYCSRAFPLTTTLVRTYLQGVQYCASTNFVGWAMGNIVKVTDYLEPTAGTQEAIAALVQKALSEVLKSTPFRSSKQSQQLLQYIVDQTLAGHAELLKERVIGAEVFGRPPDYDTNEDPIVRGRAAEVRKRLAQYYVDEGHRCPIRVEISPGSYHATFSDSSKFHAKESGIPEFDPVHHQEPVHLPR